MQEGKPRDTLLKYDDPIESLVPISQSEQKIVAKGLPSTFRVRTRGAI